MHRHGYKVSTSGVHRALHLKHVTLHKITNKTSEVEKKTKFSLGRSLQHFIASFHQIHFVSELMVKGV
jgi:hypothetical protein